jgi:hypothetical protein
MDPIRPAPSSTLSPMSFALSQFGTAFSRAVIVAARPLVWLTSGMASGIRGIASMIRPPLRQRTAAAAPARAINDAPDLRSPPTTQVKIERLSVALQHGDFLCDKDIFRAASRKATLELLSDLDADNEFAENTLNDSNNAVAFGNAYKALLQQDPPLGKDSVAQLLSAVEHEAAFIKGEQDAPKTKRQEDLLKNIRFNPSTEAVIGNIMRGLPETERARFVGMMTLMKTTLGKVATGDGLEKTRTNKVSLSRCFGNVIFPHTGLQTVPECNKRVAVFQYLLEDFLNPEGTLFKSCSVNLVDFENKGSAAGSESSHITSWETLQIDNFRNETVDSIDSKASRAPQGSGPITFHAPASATSGLRTSLPSVHSASARENHAFSPDIIDRLAQWGAQSGERPRADLFLVHPTEPETMQKLGPQISQTLTAFSEAPSWAQVPALYQSIRIQPGVPASLIARVDRQFEEYLEKFSDQFGE